LCRGILWSSRRWPRGEVIVSRRTHEIGDGFRIPEIMEQSGALLREVGTTNRTKLADYENAINEKTRMLLRVHPSNFTVTGFTDKPSSKSWWRSASGADCRLWKISAPVACRTAEHGITEQRCVKA